MTRTLDAPAPGVEPWPIAKRKRNQYGLGSMGRASSAGIELAIAVVAFLLLGWWLDGKLGTAPWLTLLGLVFGSGVGFRSLWKAAQEAAARADDEDQD